MGGAAKPPRPPGAGISLRLLAHAAELLELGYTEVQVRDAMRHAVLTKCRKSEAARRLGIGRRTLVRWNRDRSDA